MIAPLLHLGNIAVAYGKVEALIGVTVDVAAGSIVTVIGANGAGKTSLLNAAMGLVACTGDIAIDGEDIRRRPTEQRLARGLTLVPERRELFSSMTVVDNLVLGGYLRTRNEVKTSLASVYERFPRLAERRSQIAGTLSGGERQMLAMGRGADGQPQGAHARRTEPRSRAAHRRGYSPDRRRPEGGRCLGAAR